jgi:hypothetical protein
MRVMAILFLLIGAALGVYRFANPNEVFAYGGLSVGFLLMGALFWWLRKVND